MSKDPRLSEDLERLVEPVTRGDPESELRWTSKSVRKLAKELQHLGHQVSHELVSELLHGLGYSLQALRKTSEGGEHPDRDGQFEHLNAQAAAFLAAGEPAVSVDAKKDGSLYHRLPLAAGHEQMEQHPASSLRLDQPELARQAEQGLRGDPAIDRGDHD